MYNLSTENVEFETKSHRAGMDDLPTICANCVLLVIAFYKY